MYPSKSTSGRAIKSFVHVSRKVCLTMFQATAVAGEIGLIFGVLTMLRLLGSSFGTNDWAASPEI